MDTMQTKPLSPSLVSRQLHAAGFLLIAPSDQHRREGMFVDKSVLGRVRVGWSHHHIGTSVRRLANDTQAELERLGYDVEVCDTPEAEYLALYVSRAA